MTEPTREPVIPQQELEPEQQAFFNSLLAEACYEGFGDIHVKVLNGKVYSMALRTEYRTPPTLTRAAIRRARHSHKKGYIKNRLEE